MHRAADGGKGSMCPVFASVFSRGQRIFRLGQL
jgi:hypothetical protein